MSLIFTNAFRYGRIVGRIIGPAVLPRSRSDNAKKLLGWLTCAKRTLKWCEVQGAVSVDFDNGTMSSDLQFQEDCKDLCASLVERSSDGSVALVHSTAKRYKASFAHDAFAEASRYLIDKGYVCVPEVEFDMAYLCLTYMSFEQFAFQANQDAIQTAIYQGGYAFVDYSSCFWAHHIIAGVREVVGLASRNLEDLAEAAGAFLDMQWASPKKRLIVSKTLEESLSALVNHDMYDNLCQAIVSTKNQLLPTGKGPSDDEPLYLPKVIQALRSELEALISSPNTTLTQKAKLKKFYGPNFFKCRRINCQFYSKGFTTQMQRDHHISKHERAFTCKEEGCPQAIIGCVTVQDLKKHMIEYHGTTIDADAEYPEHEPETDADAKRKQKMPALFQCSMCPKRFTRAYNLRTHLRTHTNERPFVCRVCGKAFVRHNDCYRHEALHSGEKKFICRGILKNGGPRGCGRRFARAEGLGRHFRSEAGRVCIRPILEEEAHERAATNGHMQQPEMRIDPAQFLDIFPPPAVPSEPAAFPAALPAALLAQYPALATGDWSQLQSGNGDEGHLPDEYNDLLTLSNGSHQAATQSLT